MRHPFLFLCFVIISSLILSNCKIIDPDDPEDVIIGTWEFTELIFNYEGNSTSYTAEQVGFTQTTIIYSNGTYRITATGDSGTEVETGTWSYDGTTLVFSSGVHSTSLPCSISGNRMQITFPSGALNLDFQGSFVMIFTKT